MNRQELEHMIEGASITFWISVLILSIWLLILGTVDSTCSVRDQCSHDKPCSQSTSD